MFQHFVDELKHCNPDMRMDLQPVSVFLCLYSKYLVVMLPFRMVYFQSMFCFIFFLVSFNVSVPLLQDLFEIFNENLSQ